MSPIGIIAGTSLLNFEFLGSLKKEIMKNKFGKVLSFRDENIIFIPRHGEQRKIPPHRINYKANIYALAENNVNFLILINSVGSLKREIIPGKLMVPHDYIALWNIQTFFDKNAIHITPEFDPLLREILISTARELKIDIYDHGIYFQTSGPRLETKAEISMLSKFADVVGMTLGTEATLAQEIGLRCASICTIDNYAHGLAKEKLNFEEVVERASKRRADLESLLLRVIDKLLSFQGEKNEHPAKERNSGKR
ncbi:MAG: 6-oxopurine nucleoside phosphorylase [Candidatus Altiarchaeales archaeon]|nr:MAG: 6-oxopurine nucleoside phosphorylase [Candidatus Altiarchaeales archaeon]